MDLITPMAKKAQWPL